MPTDHESYGDGRPSGRQPRILVVGSYAKALVITAERIPRSGETLLGQDYRETFGGKGSDMAVQAARLGAQVDYVGVVGADNHGREFADLMAAEGVDTTHLRVHPDHPTGVGLIVKDTAGHNLIVVDMGANTTCSVADVDGAIRAGAPPDVVLTQLEIPLETALHAMVAGRRAGARTILNPAPAVDLRGRRLDAVDVITPNEHEAKILVGLDPDDPSSETTVAERLLDLGVSTVIVTRGEHGAVIVDRVGGQLRSTTVAPWPVDVLDSNGAGDSFNAALAVALAEGRDLIDAAQFAGAVAALCCEGWETVPSYRHRDSVEAYLRTHTSRKGGR